MAQRTSVWRNSFKTFRYFGETIIMVLIANIRLGTGSQNYKCQKYVISWLHNAGIAVTSIIKQTRRFYV